MRVADYLFRTLADYGVRHVFLVTGGGAMFLNNGLLHERRITPVCCHNESGAAIAAEGYARVAEKLAVVSVTTGPGGTNALTGVIGEWLDSQPVLYLSGQVKLATSTASQPELPLRQLGDQEINIVEMVKPVTKYAKTVTDPMQIRAEVEKAVYLATHGRKGPVWLDIPINVQSAEIDPVRLPGWNCDAADLPPPDETLLPAVAASLKAAKSPVIIAGQGIRLSGALREFREMADRLQIPVLATFGGFDMMPTAHPLMIGRIGTIGTRAGNIALQNADWVLCLGSRNNIRQVSYNFEHFASRAKTFIMVDADAAELAKKTIRPTLKICADARHFITKLTAALAGWTAPEEHRRWLNWCQERKRRYPVVLNEYRNLKEGLNPYLFAEMLTALLPERAVVACANATPSLALFQAGIVREGDRMFCNSGCAAMGFGLPASLGAAAAAEGRPVICLEGDGSLMMNVQELQTVSAHHLPVKLFLFNNGEYCSIRQTHDNFFGERIGCDASSGVTFPDWKLLAAAFHWRYESVADEAEAAEKLPGILAAKEPVFCDIRLVPGYTFAPKLSSRRLPDGTLESPSLEDMFPFLPPGEMKENIYDA